MSMVCAIFVLKIHLPSASSSAMPNVQCPSSCFVFERLHVTVFFFCLWGSFFVATTAIVGRGHSGSVGRAFMASKRANPVESFAAPLAFLGRKRYRTTT